MARIEGVENERAGMFVRLAYRMVKRRLGRVVLPIKITAHQPRLLGGLAAMETAQEKVRTVDAGLKALCQIKVAMMVGCPF